MTNPPFYDSASESSMSAQDIISRPLEGNGRSRTHMTVSEGTYPGGEVGFVLDIFIDWYNALVEATAPTTTPTTTTTTQPPVSASLPPAWCSAMIGKKSSFQYIHKVLTKILGYGHVRATEYGPGVYTRWFVAWRTVRPTTVVQYSIKDHRTTTLLPRHPTKDHFVVKIDTSDGPDDNDDDMDDMNMEDDGGGVDVARNSCTDVALVWKVARRIRQYCNSNPGGWELQAITTTATGSTGAANVTMTVTITERQVKPVLVYVDELHGDAGNDDGDGSSISHTADDLIPPEILHLLQQRSQQHDSNTRRPQQSWLPIEGHFLIDLHLHCVHSSSSQPSVCVSMTCYRHSTRGMKAVEKVRSTIEGEICRTNRKWRKIRQRRQEQQNQQPAQL